MNGAVDATSIVLQILPNRILVAADTRVGKSTNGGPEAFEDTECKIVPLGNSAAFAVTGDDSYVRSELSDPVASWDSRSDAREAYAEENGNLIAAADNWATRVKHFFLSAYFSNPAFVKRAASHNQLLVGYFAGFQDSKPVVLERVVYLDDHTFQIILDEQHVLPTRELPHTSNSITQDLIEGHSEAANDSWQKKSKSIPLSDRNFRRLEFLIQFTANSDRSVGKQVNVLEISPDKKPHWLQNSTCPYD